MVLRTVAVALSLTVASGAQAAEPGVPPVPGAVRALAGCWAGEGAVQGKPVAVTLAAHAILQDAMIAMDSEAVAKADAQDRYSAHLLFGAGARQKGDKGEPISSFWADSFGGTFTATGAGASRSDGFDVVYRYPDSAFVNRWRLSADRLEWSIAARDRKGRESGFARYVLMRTACPAAS